MKTHTQAYKNNIKTLGREITSKITYTLDEEEIELGPEELNSISPHYEASLLKSVMKQLDLDSNVDIPVGTEINYQFGQKVGNSYEYLDFGNYIVFSSEKKEDTESYEIVAYDKMLYAMKEYQDVEYTFPMTIRTYINNICTTLGLTFANASDTFTNYNRQLTSDVFLDTEGESLGYTFRDVLDQIAEVTASTICINQDDELEIRYINDTVGNLIKESTLTSAPTNQANWVLGTMNNVTSSSYSSNGLTVTTPANQGVTNNGRTITIKNANDLIPAGTKVTFSIDITGSAVYGHVKGFYRGTGPYFYSNNVVIIPDTKTTSNETKRYVGTFIMPDVGTALKDFYIDLGQGKDAITTRTYKNAMLEFGNETYYTYSGDNIDEEYLKDVNVKFGEKYGPINSIVLSRSAGADNVYLQDTASVEANGLCEIKISDNQIMNGNNRADYLPDILAKLDGLEYHINDFSSTGITYYDLCDRYNIKVGENTYSCIMLNDEINVTQGIEELVHTDKPEDSETDYSKADKTDRRINQTILQVDKQNQVIQAIVSTQETMTGEISDLQESIEIFSVDLSQYNLVVSTDSDRKPFATETLSTNFYAYYKGHQVNPTVTVTGSQNGMTKSTTSTAINFGVTAGSQIANKSYTYTATFTYTADGATYTATKKIVVALSMQGQTGGTGPQGPQGETGPQGPKGDTGATGPQGPQGEQGEQGEKGDTGSQGPKGDTGDKGDKGDKGDTGDTGPQGPTGKGISSVSYYYKTTTDQTEPSASSITGTTIPTMSSTDKYLWRKEVITYTDFTTKTTVSLISIYGDTGQQGPQGQQGNPGQAGADGNGISSITYYYKTTTNSTAPSADSITSTTMPSIDATNKYLWQKEVITYTKATAKTTVLLLAVYGDTGQQGPTGPTGPTGPQGPTGATGTGIESITEQYYLSTSKTTQTGGSWVDTPPAWVQGKYIWTRSKIVYKNPTSTAYTTPLVSSEWEAVNEVPNYIASRGENLVTNGTALLGNNTNFSILEYDGSDTYYAGGSFKGTSYKNVATDEFIPVDVSGTYELSYYIKVDKEGIRYYDFIQCFDIDKLNISDGNVMYVPGSLTTLARELKNGDTTVYLTDVSGFVKNKNGIYSRKLIFWNYTNSFGYTYPPETYSRNVTATNLWADDNTDIDYTNNKITLRTAWTGGTYAAGTKVSQGNNGANMKYLNANYTLEKDVWTHKSGKISGLGNNNSSGFRDGTAYVKPGWWFSYGNATSGAVSRISTITFTQNTGIGESVASLDVEYYLSTSSSTPTGGSWSTTAPAWVDGKYMWSRQKLTYGDGTVQYKNQTCIAGAKGATGPQGPQGIQGPAGANGTSTYFYVRYSANSDGSNMTTTPQSNTQYMGVASTTSSTAPTQPSGYVWSKIKGEQGQQGIQGPTGEDGTSSYLHIKWSDDGTTFTPAEGSTPAGKTPGRWQGTYVDTNETDSATFSDYNWVDTGIYVQDQLNALESGIGAVDARVTDTNTNIANNYYNKDQVDALSEANANNIAIVQQRVVTLEQKSDSYAININKILTDGVSSVTTTSGYVFNENGLNITKTGSEISNLLDNTGMFVRRNSTEMLGADATGVRSENLWVRKYLQMGTNSRFEDYETSRTACFYIGGSN